MIVNCVTCGREIPADAAYCIYCAAPAGPTKQATVGVSAAPATGATIRLDPDEDPALKTPVASPKPHHVPRRARPNRARHKPQAQRHRDPSTPLFLIGLVLIFWLRLPWQSVMLLLGFTHFVKEASYGRQAHAIRNLLFLVGLGLIFIAHAFWPGIALVIIAMIASQLGHHWRCSGGQP